MSVSRSTVYFPKKPQDGELQLAYDVVTNEHGMLVKLEVVNKQVDLKKFVEQASTNAHLKALEVVKSYPWICSSWVRGPSQNDDGMLDWRQRLTNHEGAFQINLQRLYELRMNMWTHDYRYLKNRIVQVAYFDKINRLCQDAQIFYYSQLIYLFRPRNTKGLILDEESPDRILDIYFTERKFLYSFFDIIAQLPVRMVKDTPSGTRNIVEEKLIARADEEAYDIPDKDLPESDAGQKAWREAVLEHLYCYLTKQAFPSLLSNFREMVRGVPFAETLRVFALTKRVEKFETIFQQSVRAGYVDYETAVKMEQKFKSDDYGFDDIQLPYSDELEIRSPSNRRNSANGV